MLTDMLFCICMLRQVSKHLSIPFQFRKKDWAKWAKWVRILKNTPTDEQQCSRRCFLVFACSDTYQNMYLFILFKIRKKDRANKKMKTMYLSNVSKTDFELFPDYGRRASRGVQLPSHPPTPTFTKSIWNAHFPTFRFVLTDQSIAQQTDQWTDNDSHRVACQQLKTLD